jgi:hypothetical protein
MVNSIGPTLTSEAAVGTVSIDAAREKTMRAERGMV